MNIPLTLKENCRLFGERPAIIDCKRGAVRIATYKQLDTWSEQLAIHFAKEGLTADSTTLVLHTMSIELYVVLIALFKLAVKAMIVDPSSGVKFMDSCFALERPTALVTTSKGSLLPLISSSVHDIPLKFRTGIGLSQFKRLSAKRVFKISLDEIKIDSGLAQGEMAALVTFTSGSTGKPKGIVRTHAFLIEQHKALETSLKLQSGEIELTALPIFVLANLASGMTTVIPDANLRKPAKVDAAKLVKQIVDHEIERAVGPPMLFQRLIEHCLAQNITLNSLKKIYTGGGPVFPQLMQKLRLIAPEARIVAVYGSTEAEPIAHIELSQISTDDLSAIKTGAGLLAGHVESCLELKIITPLTDTNEVQNFTSTEFAAMSQPVNSPGEIVVAGNHVIKGYLRGEGDCQTKFKVDNNVWHRTGDAGYLDATGKLWLLGRESAKIVDARGTLYPFQIEAAACEHPAIRVAACLLFNGKRTLLIQPDASFDHRNKTKVANLFATLRHDLQGMYIEDIRLCKAIPMDKRHNSKVVYSEVAKLLSAGVI